MPPRNFVTPQSIHKEFETAIAIVQGFIIKNSPPPKPTHDELSGDKVLGPTFKKPDKTVVKGVGLDANRRAALRIDLNAFLDSVGAANGLKPSQVDAKTTIDALVNNLFNLWP